MLSARESVGASSPKRNRHKSFGICVGGQEAKASGRWRSFGSGTVRPRRQEALRGACRRAGGQTPGRSALFPDRRRPAFGLAGAVTGGRGTLRGHAVSGAKIPSRGGRDATKGAGAVEGWASRRRSPARGIRPLAARPPLHGGVRGARRSEARSLLSAAELRLPRRQECPARTRSVGSRLRS